MKNTRANRFCLLLTLASVQLSPNCATLTRKTTQRIPVTSSPAGATVSVNGVQQGVTPLEIRLARRKGGKFLRIESPGYNPVEIQVKRKWSASPFLWDALLGGAAAAFYGVGAELADYDPDLRDEGALICFAIPILIDLTFNLAFGKGSTLRPKELIVTLTKLDGSPRVDTIFVDPDDLRNVKWIRIRRE